MGSCYGPYDIQDGAHISTSHPPRLSSPDRRLCPSFPARFPDGSPGLGGCDLTPRTDPRANPRPDARTGPSPNSGPDPGPNRSARLALLLLLFAATLSASLPAAAQAPVSPAAPPATPILRAARFVVILDAAHGGDDGGAHLGSAVAEKTVTLALSVRLRSLLTARGFQVVTTREGNVNLDADARAQIANRAVAATGSSACISLHATESGSGVHLFISPIAATPPTRFLPWKTAQSAYVNRSLKLAGALNAAFEHSGDASAGTEAAAPIAATLARASAAGLDSMACPAVAVEVAPIRGADRAIVTDVTDAQYQGQIVEALAAALLEWKTEWESDPAHTGVHQP
jgi:N-acetylmuramoyl-L-alanine amidase